MKNLLNKLVALGLVMGIASFVPTASAGFPTQLMTFATQHEGHEALRAHPFTLLLKTRNKKGKLEVRWEQVAQYLRDRATLFSIMEETLKESHPEYDPDRYEDEIFFRSYAYEKSLKNLVGEWYQIEPSEQALQYGEYLSQLDPKLIKLHLWAFLIGETFGGINIHGYISQKFWIGDSIIEFGGLNLMQSRQRYNAWLDKIWTKQDQRYDEEMTRTFEYAYGLADAAYNARKVTVCGRAGATFSLLCYLTFNDS